MLDKSIDGALLALRKQIIRGNGEGLKHVEALLAVRDVPMPRVLPAKGPDVAGKGQMAALALKALRDGPKTLAGIAAAHVAERRPGLSQFDAKKRTALALYKLRKRGMVRREGAGVVAGPVGPSPMLRTMLLQYRICCPDQYA